MHIDCEFLKKSGRCMLGFYGGFPSPGTCRICIDRGENNREFADALAESHAKSHPGAAPRISGCCDRADQA